MRKVHVSILFFLVVVFFLTETVFPVDTGTQSASWTFMVYLDGDNNLESAGIGDFLEMSQVGSTADVNIVVQFDRIAGYNGGYDDWTGTKRFLVTNGMTPTAANAVMDIGEANMGDPATLIDFVDWAKTNYPATNYAVILWNHGGGWRREGKTRYRVPEEKETALLKAVCWDDTDGGDSLYMSEVKDALSAFTGADVIGFDACLMGLVEVAYEIKDHGQVMVGSEETEPFNGWPYDTILADLTANPSWTPVQLGSAIVDRYYASYGSSETQAAIDLTRMDTLAGTISTFAQTMMDSWDSDETAVKNAAQAVMAEISNAVINEKHGSGWPGANGLAIYFPDTAGSFNSSYNGSIISFPNDTQWDEFLQEYYSSMGGSWLVEKRAGAQEFYYDTQIDLYHFCHLINLVKDDLYTDSQLPHEYTDGGTAQNFQEDEDYLTIPLPFDFPYFGEVIPSGSLIYVSSNGYVDFDAGSDHTDYENSLGKLATNKRIAPMWTDLTTYGDEQAGEDIYITENTDSLVIRWAAETWMDLAPVNVELILHRSGEIQFNFGGDNTNTSGWNGGPTIGISKGDGINYYLSDHNSRTILTYAETSFFTPAWPFININTPTGGESLTLGTSESISWDAPALSGYVKITLWKDGALVGVVATAAAAAGTYSWTVGESSAGTVSPGTGYSIKIKEKGTAVADFCDSPFTISPPPSITVTSPNGGESPDFGTTQNITWDAVGISGYVKICLLKNGIVVGVIAGSVPASNGSYPWTIGQLLNSTVPPGTGYTIKIKEKGTAVADVSDSPFTISPAASLTVTSPNGNESWVIGSTRNITWNASGIPGNVKITLFKNGAAVGTIMNVPAATGSYSWTVGQYVGGTAPAGTGYKIKIKEKNTPVADISDAEFDLSI